MYYQFSRRHLTGNYIGYNFMLSLNFRFTARFVPLKVYRGHGHLLQLPPAHPLPHTVAIFSYQAEPFCLLCIYHRVSDYLLDTIQALLTYLYYETESSEIFFQHTHEISILLATFYLRAHGFCNSCSHIKISILGPTHRYFYLEDKSSKLFNRNKHFNLASNLHYATFSVSVLAACL